ncbi:FKBP-type peptidyl-prolyl cis-trans isomerase [Algiphilus aromaticivorans]|jgi:FKBP-type peptidyl-prolyl cis-trans isomerase FkpA/FKBP-type peptidyl-prolyl cis-trans isomerase FklB|uniref:FKBP-type peptidyl-prolyl cis-trans isomerase n=1 Tax=Algiphilus aromaticivorans TaxID=382454 RepID=UPI0006936520|nr:FKBP-type peptidyl-prolyl cis-trans isomerase [Algiphilus aromaticivorans]
MRKIQLTAVASAAVLLIACQGQQEGGNESSKAPAALDSDAARFSYAVGVDLGNSLQAVDESEVDLDALDRGIREAYAGEDLAIDEAERAEIKNQVAQRLQKKQAEQQAQQGSEAAEKGAAYQEENAQRDGVEVTESGLQFEQLEKGEGASPSESDTVTVHYKGELIDGTEFDSSYERGEPATFPLGNVIPGWTEALQKMQEGGKARLVIPPELAYGEQGAGNRIGPNETLVFEVELIEVADEGDNGDGEDSENGGD